MAKSKITSNDFDRFLEDSEECAAFAPTSQPPPPDVAASSVPEIKPSKTGNKLGTKQEQTKNKSAATTVQIREQTGNKVAAKWEQISAKDSETGNKVVSQLGTGVGTNWEQSGSKLGTNRDVSTLRGLQKRILVFLYQSCLKARSQNTERLAVQNIAESCETSIQSVKVTIRRLEKMRLLERKSFENGRGGWTVYALPNSVHSYLRLDETENKLGTNWEQSGSKVVSQLGTQLGTSPPSSSRDLFLNNSTTTQNVDNSDPDAAALKNVDLSLVTEFGITASTISRCLGLYPSVSHDQLAALIERFGKFMKTPDGKRVQNARGFFISLAEQLSKGVTPLDYIETRDEALMREFVMQSKEAKARRELLEKEAFEFAFEEWIEKLGSKSRDELVPPTSVIESGSKIQTMKLKEHFRLNVWPSRFAISKEAPDAGV